MKAEVRTDRLALHWPPGDQKETVSRPLARHRVDGGSRRVQSNAKRSETGRGDEAGGSGVVPCDPDGDAPARRLCLLSGALV
ncbi:hypothetical protein EYF80_042268 [Liparis tanakae]|uniref:Uncharacterized protein n=1 Tax=Liparis tanakae TaxID=230148 RepID=A0A4Z2G216_9TELE|nr:hypothetical protein EYF80_042268 [Liparis tanakae]